MGHTAWLLLAPAAPTVAAFAICLHVVSLGVRLDAFGTPATIAVP